MEWRRPRLLMLRRRARLQLSVSACPPSPLTFDDRERHTAGCSTGRASARHSRGLAASDSEVDCRFDLPGCAASFGAEGHADASSGLRSAGVHFCRHRPRCCGKFSARGVCHVSSTSWQRPSSIGVGECLASAVCSLAGPRLARRLRSRTAQGRSHGAHATCSIPFPTIGRKNKFAARLSRSAKWRPWFSSHSSNLWRRRGIASVTTSGSASVTFQQSATGCSVRGRLSGFRSLSADCPERGRGLHPRGPHRQRRQQRFKAPRQGVSAAVSGMRHRCIGPVSSQAETTNVNNCWLASGSSAQC